MAKPKPQPPAASPKKDPVTVNDVVPSSCRKCGSTDRSPYRGTTTQSISGILDDGRPYNVIVWRYCTCLKCLQVRCDRTFENASDPGSCVERTEPVNSGGEPPESG